MKSSRSQRISARPDREGNGSALTSLLCAVLIAGASLTGCTHHDGGPGAGTIPMPGEDAPVKLTRSSLKEASADIADGRLTDAFKIYQAILSTTPPDDKRRPEALYWAGMLRLSSDPSLRDLEKGRALLRSLTAVYPSWDRRYEASLALSLLGEIDAGRAAVADGEGRLAEAKLGTETCRKDLQDLNEQLNAGAEEARVLKAALAARRSEVEGLRQEVRRKDEAIQKIKEAVVGWKPSR